MTPSIFRAVRSLHGPLPLVLRIAGMHVFLFGVKLNIFVKIDSPLRESTREMMVESCSIVSVTCSERGGPIGRFQ